MVDTESLVVDAAALRARGGDAGELAERLADVRRAWATAADEPGGTLGYRESTQRYTELVDAWFGELGGYLRVLEELDQGLAGAAAGYLDADGEAAVAITAAGP